MTYKLYCFAESGNAYKAALMLQLCQIPWQPIWVDFFNGETKSFAYRSTVNELGEVPVLVNEGKRVSQSGVILDYLAEKARKFGAKSEDERREILRWMLFDNHKFSSNIATLRYLASLNKGDETPVTAFLRQRALNALAIVDAHLAKRNFLIGKRPTIADLSLSSYLFYGDEVPLPLQQFTHVMNWLDRIMALPNWKGPYELMPRAP